MPLSPQAADLIAANSQQALWEAIRRAGYNPQYSQFGRAMMNRAGDLTQLAIANMQGDDAVDNFQSFADAYAQAMLRGGSGGGQYNLSRPGQRSSLATAMGSAPGTDYYGYLTEGKPDEQFARFSDISRIQQGGRFAPLVQANLNTQEGRYRDFQSAQLRNEPGTENTQWIDYYLNRQGPGVGSTYAPTGGAAATSTGGPQAQTGPYANVGKTTATGTTGMTQTPIPNPWPVGSPNNPSPTGYGQSAAGPQGDLNAPISSTGAGPNTGQPLPAGANANAGGNQGAAQMQQQTITDPNTYQAMAERANNYTGQAGAAPAQFQNAMALINQFQGDRRNWGTRMMGHPDQGFSFGGVTYNPALEQAQGAQRYKGMSGQGRETARGSAFGQYLYTLDLLMKQRNGAGNAALGVTRATTDQQLAQIAARYIGQHLIGQNPFSVA